MAFNFAGLDQECATASPKVKPRPPPKVRTKSVNAPGTPELAKELRDRLTYTPPPPPPSIERTKTQQFLPESQKYTRHPGE